MEPAPRAACLGLDQGEPFRDAGGARCRPERQHHDLTAIVGQVAGDRLESATKLAASSGLTYRTVATPTVTLAAWTRMSDPRQMVTIYIEGDGAAYGPDGQPSLDPTPRHPLGLRLAMADPAANVIYLGRPCQYVRDPRCRTADWTTQRFAEPAVVAMGAALDRLLPPNAKIELIGYSGGAAIAVQLAARRTDVVSLRTVAGNLDPQGVNRLHRATEFLVAPEPLAPPSRLVGLPQRHFVGRRDQVVPASIAEKFVLAMGPNACAAITMVNANHEDGWEDAWRGLRAEVLPCG